MTVETFSLDKLVPDYIRHFEAYIPSRPDHEHKKLFGCNNLFRLNNNENPLGPPAKAKQIIEKFESMKAAEYPSGDAYYLKIRLAEKFNMMPDQFIVGNGANEVIAFVIKAFCREGDNIITADKTFAVYEWVAQFSGFEARLVPLKDFGFDKEGMLERVDDRTKILFLCNPNNPTGTYWNQDKLIKFLDKIAGKKIVVVDEAYCEFVEKKDYPDCMKLLSKYPNLVIFRTFSKMYGLAGLRIGYLAGNLEVVDIIRRTCIVYSVNAIAQLAALAVLEDSEHVLKTRDHIHKEKKYLTEYIQKLGLEYKSGEGCFVMIRLPISDTIAYRKFMAHGVMIRSMTSFRFPGWIRVSIGTHDAMKKFIKILKTIILEPIQTHE